MDVLKKAVLPLILVFALAVLVVRMDSGIWDPWEMNRAHVARQLVGQSKVLVIGAGDDLLGTLESRFPGAAYYSGVDVPPEGPRPAGQGAANRPRRSDRIATRAGEQLKAEIFHGVFVEAAVLAEEPANGVTLLEMVETESPGARHLVVAKSDEECLSTVAALERAMARQAAEALQTGYLLLPADYDIDGLAAARAGSYPFVLAIDCVTADGEELAEAVGGLSWVRWTRVQFKGMAQAKTKKIPNPPTNTWSVPPLDYWLTGLSYQVFGFSEATSRLPTLCFALGTLLIFALGLGRFFGRDVASLATLVLLSTPLFFGQAKNMSGEMSFTFFLTLAMVSFFGLVKDGWSPSRLAGMLLAAAGLLLAKGLFGVGLLLLILVLYMILAGDWRRRDLLLPTGLLVVLFAGLVVLVQLPQEWTFFEHFKFMNKAFGGGLTEERRTFDFFVRHVSFVLMPWTLVLPFAIARLIPLDENRQWSDRRRLELVTFLWFCVPFVLQSALLPGFLHTVYPGVTAVALAVVLLWRAEEVERSSRFQAMVVLGIAAVILANLFKSPQHLLSFLALDPELGLEETNPFPPDFVTPGTIKALLGLTALALATYYARGGAILRSVLAFFRKPLPFWIALWTLMVLFVVRLVAGLASRFQMALSDKNAGRLPVATVEFFQELFGLRIESIALYLGLGGVALAGLLFFTPVGPWLGRWLRWLAPLGRLVVKAQGVLARDLVGLSLALAMGAAALIDILVTFEFPAGSRGAVMASPAFMAGLLIPLTTATGAGVWFGLGRAMGNGVDWRSLLRVFGGSVVVGLMVITSAFFRVTDLGAADIWILSLGSFVVLCGYAVGRVLERPVALHLAAWGLLLALGVALFVPMALRWEVVEQTVFPKSQVRYLPYLLLESRLTWLPVVLALFFVATYLLPQTTSFVRRFGPLDRFFSRLGGWNPARWPDQMERRNVAAAVVLVLALGSGGIYAVKLLPGFSREVSQKHILEIYYDAEGRSDLGDDIFKYNGQAGDEPEDKNFYTARIPAISSQTDLTAVLLGQTDTVVKVHRSSSHPGPSHVLVRGFSKANDADGDGQRDLPADAGIADLIADGRLVDDSQQWQPDEWRDALLFDGRGKPFEITGNDATSLTLAVTPPAAQRPAALRYLIDSPQAADHNASALTRKRNYVILSQEAFSSVNFTFRSQSDGMHIPVLDGTNVNFLLAAGFLLDGEKNHNRFANATIAPERFQALMDWTADAGGDAAVFGVDDELAQHGPMRSGYINFDDQIRFQGYQMKRTSLARGEKVNLRLFFECTGKLSTSWKIFIHMDSTGDSNRIHGDHWPLNMTNDPEDKKCSGCWRTNHWMKGDIVLDDYQTEIPMGSPSGIYNVYMGLYTPGSDKRLKVKDYDKKRIRHDGKDRVFIGTFEVH